MSDAVCVVHSVQLLAMPEMRRSLSHEVWLPLALDKSVRPSLFTLRPAEMGRRGTGIGAHAQYNVVGLRTYEIAVGASLVVVFFALVLIAEAMRRQVHEGRYGNQQVGPWDAHFVNTLLGQHGLWNSHKRLYQRSRLRSCFSALLIALFICFVVGAYVYLYARP